MQSSDMEPAGAGSRSKESTHTQYAEYQRQLPDDSILFPRDRRKLSETRDMLFYAMLPFNHASGLWSSIEVISPKNERILSVDRNDVEKGIELWQHPMNITDGVVFTHMLSDLLSEGVEIHSTRKKSTMHW